MAENISQLAWTCDQLGNINGQCFGSPGPREVEHKLPAETRLKLGHHAASLPRHKKI
jgi:hypothetical protein